MSTQLETLLDKMKILEKELVDELQKQGEESTYEFREQRIHFEKDIIAQHKEPVKNRLIYIKSGAPLNTPGE